MSLYAVASVIEQRDVGAGQLFPKIFQGGVEAGLIEPSPPSFTGSDRNY
jgi:hypothetical protein